MVRIIMATFLCYAADCKGAPEAGGRQILSGSDLHGDLLVG